LIFCKTWKVNFSFRKSSKNPKQICNNGSGNFSNQVLKRHCCQT